MFFDLTVFLHEVVIDAMAHHSEISTPSERAGCNF
jgi:hypothetical protein